VHQDTLDRDPIRQKDRLTADRAERGKLTARVTPVAVYPCLALAGIGTYYLLPEAGVAQAAATTVWRSAGVIRRGRPERGASAKLQSSARNRRHHLRTVAG